ncbi:MAG: type VI secretion system baseplate subunit TssF [Opitutaceae bacterium]|nr:type VI secretion system baseplate subunit TssF [Cytophagales bacterium]
MNKQIQTKEDIKSRILRHISAIWGVKNTDSLDPLVRMLIEALSGEMQKTNQEIIEFEKRILEKISFVMTPSLLSAPHCAHGIMHAAPTETTQYITPATSFIIKKKSLEQDAGIDLFFTPCSKTRLINGSVKYIITANSVFEYDMNMQKSVLSNHIENTSEKYKIWIGLQIDKVQTLSFYFDFLNNEDKNFSLLAIKNAEWKVSDNVLNVEGGYEPDHGRKPIQNIFEGNDPMYMIEKEVSNFYAKQFVTISFPEELRTKSLFPPIFDEYFSKSETSIFKEDLVWISINTQVPLDEKLLNTFFVSINSFPVLNRSQKESILRFKGISNLIPIRTENFEYFLSVKDIKDSDGREFKQIAFSDQENIQKGTYSIRKGGTEKMDPRSAKEYLNNLVELVRDEYATFSGFGQDTVGTLLKDLDKILVQITQRIKQNKNFNSDITSYVSLDTMEHSESVFLNYWTTNGPHANGLFAGSKFKLTKGSEINKDSMVLLSKTLGGKKDLEPSRHIEAFKYAMLTHDRLITAEDLKAFCFYELGEKIDKVEIQKTYVTSDNIKEGLVKCVEIILTKKNEKSPTSDLEWNGLLSEVQAKMELRSALNMRLKLTVKQH